MIYYVQPIKHFVHSHDLLIENNLKLFRKENTYGVQN